MTFALDLDKSLACMGFKAFTIKKFAQHHTLNLEHTLSSFTRTSSQKDITNVIYQNTFKMY